MTARFADSCRRALLLMILFGVALSLAALSGVVAVEAKRRPTPAVRIFMPVLRRSPRPPAPPPTPTATPWLTPTPAPTPVPEPCAGVQGIPAASYDAITVEGAPTDRPAEQHGDLNLALRGYVPTADYAGLVDYGGESDGSAPQLAGLFADIRTPAFVRSSRVYDWNWACNCRGELIASPPVTLSGLVTIPGEEIRVPASGYGIGELSDGFEVLVLYAARDRITLKYTREDNVIHGYTLHLEGVCVDPALLSLYGSMNAEGRGRLPALRAGQSFGRAGGGEIGVAIRDNGTFMDPRSRKDWWVGR